MSASQAIESAISDMAILIVDDSEVARMVLEKSLRNRGFQTILTVESGERALEEFDRFHTDIVILDVMMPGMGGLACCNAIRSVAQNREVPVLIGTSATELSLRLQAFENGATDFINTPILPDELYARVKVHLQNRKYMKELRQYKDRMTAEMDSAYALQTSILPNEDELTAIYAHNGLDIASHFEPSSEIGGDFWGVKSLTSGHTALWMADLSGHGITAALNAFRLHAYLNEDSPFAHLPGEYVTRLNSKMVELLNEGHFATLFYGVIDLAMNELTYSCACAPHPLLIRGSSGKPQLLQGQGNLMGINAHVYTPHRVEMFVGDTLILYSDALIETEGTDGRFIEEETLLAIAEKYANTSAMQIRDAIVDHLHKHTRGSMRDDFTLCVCQRLPFDHPAR